MKFRRGISNQTDSGSAYIENIIGYEGEYELTMRFTFMGRVGYNSYTLRTNGLPILNSDMLDIAMSNGKPLELSVEEIGETNHFSPARLELTRRLLGLRP